MLLFLLLKAEVHALSREVVVVRVGSDGVGPAPFGEAMRAVVISVVIAEGGHGGRGTDELSHGVQAGADFRERKREVRASGERSVATDRPSDVRNYSRIMISG
jgi:hypothetical protein